MNFRHWFFRHQRPQTHGRQRAWAGAWPSSGWMFFVLVGLEIHSVAAAPLTLQTVEFRALPGDRIQYQLSFDGPAVEPKTFSTDNPARIALDFPEVTNGLAEKTIAVNLGVATNVHAVAVDHRTRVVLDLLALVPFDVEVQGNAVLVTLMSGDAGGSWVADQPVAEGLPMQSIENIDFRRGQQGEGKILVSLKDPNVLVDIHDAGNKVVVNFFNTELPPHLAKRLDVVDFATPVASIETLPAGKQTRMTITPTSANYDYLSYQKDSILNLEFRPLTAAEQEQKKKAEKSYRGDRLSLNFQNIPVRAVLQIMADFTNLNIVASDSIKGNVTLRLNDVPWDQALDVILKSKGLAQRQAGKLIMIAPFEEIDKQEKEELKALQTKEALEPLKTEIIQVNYAKAADIKQVLMGFKEKAAEVSTYDPDYTGYFAGDGPPEVTQETDVKGGSVLSKRGVVNVDERTNVLIIKDTPTNLEAARKMVRQLDKPVRQVLIESRVVIANDDFAKRLGARFRAFANAEDKDSDSFKIVRGAVDPTDLLVDLPIAGATGGIGFVIGRVGDYLLDLELTAAQNEGKSEVLSAPRVITSDKSKASISQGFEIPFQSSSANFGTNTQFKKAELKLDVTPLITPDDRVIMDLVVTKDQPTGALGTFQPSIETRKVRTTVQVDNGETVVLGGVFEQTQTQNSDKVPFFGDIPLIGYFFKNNRRVDNKRELMIFVTPKILKEALSPL